MKYIICGMEATMSKNPQDIFNHKITAEIEGERDGYGWIDFAWYSEIEATPETLFSVVSEWIDSESRNIEVFSVKDENNNVVLTEENL